MPALPNTPPMGGHVDNGAALAHVEQYVLGQIEQGGLVNGNDLVPPFIGALGNGAVLIGDARIVYQNIYPAKILDGFLYHMGAVCMDGQIRLYGQRFNPIGSALCGGLLQQLIAAGAQHHSGAFLSKTDGQWPCQCRSSRRLQ